MLKFLKKFFKKQKVEKEVFSPKDFVPCPICGKFIKPGEKIKLVWFNKEEKLKQKDYLLKIDEFYIACTNIECSKSSTFNGILLKDRKIEQNKEKMRTRYYFGTLKWDYFL